MKLNEDLLPNDLIDLVEPVFEIDSYKSKMGTDSDICVLSFTVNEEKPATDLMNFCEKGFDFVLDADVSAGELEDGKYKVFIEIERDKELGKNIFELVDGLKKLTGIENPKFRYYKNFRSFDVDEQTINEVIPTNKEEYEQKIQETANSNFKLFFNNGYVDSVEMLGENIIFKKKYAGPLTFKFKDCGPKDELLTRINDRIQIQQQDIAECIFLTKYLGNYNITKFGNNFFFENRGFSVLLEKK